MIASSSIVKRRNGKVALERTKPNAQTDEAKAFPLYFYFSLLIDMFCVALVVPLMSTFVEHFGVSRTWLGAVMAVYGIIQTISTPIMGVLSDKLGKRPILLVSIGGTAVGYLVLAMAGSLQLFWLFILSRVVLGAVRHSASVASALVAERYGGSSNAEKREKSTAAGLGRLQAAISLGFVLGPLAGGFLADWYGLVFVASASAAINTLNLFLMMHATSAVSQDEAKRKKLDISVEKKQSDQGGFNPITLFVKLLFGSRDLSLMLLAMYFLSLSSMLAHTTLGLVLRDQFDFPLSFTGVVISAVSAVSTVVQWFLVPFLVGKFSVRSLTLCSLWVTVAGCAAQSFAYGSSTTFLFGLGVVSIVGAVAGTLNKTHFSSVIGPERAGEAMSAVFMMDGFNRVVGPLAGGVLSDLVGHPLAPVFGATCAAFLAASIRSFQK